jgi:hypothetical protein
MSRRRAVGTSGCSALAAGTGERRPREIWLRDLDGYLVVLAEPYK